MNFEESLPQIKQGFIGENIIREYLKKRKVKFMQIDLMWEHEGKWYVGEVKAQEKFTKGFGCNFDGHGLPPYQMKARIKFGRDKDIVPVFFVYDTQEKVVYWQFFETLDSLPEDKKHITKTGKRIIFNIECFKKIDL